MSLGSPASCGGCMKIWDSEAVRLFTCKNAVAISIDPMSHRLCAAIIVTSRTPSFVAVGESTGSPFKFS